MSEATGGAISRVIRGPIRGPTRSEILVDGDCNHEGQSRSARRAAESDLVVADEGLSAHRTWAAAFEDTTSAARLQRFGSIVLHLFSRWITVRDEDNDILAGTYLQGIQVAKLGDKLEIDGVQVVVGNAWEATRDDEEITQRSCDTNILSVDLAMELRFLLEIRKEASCRLQLINKIEGIVVFNIKINLNKYSVRPSQGTMLHCSRLCYVVVTLSAQEAAPPYMRCDDMLLVQSTRVLVTSIMKNCSTWPWQIYKVVGVYNVHISSNI
ncbi:hypothetical protein ZWY2020_046120 [Hordeum vulgare]|nr:hypothetical protein ZWY2020_046120 [Hordeum vulgare]